MGANLALAAQSNFSGPPAMKHLLAAAMLALAGAAALASPAESVIQSDIERGEREFEFAVGTERNADGDEESAVLVSFGTGVTHRWATEVGVEFARTNGEALRYDGVEWENRIGLIIDEEAPVGLSLFVGLERPREHDEGWSATVGLLSETRLGRFLLDANLLAERTWGAGDGADAEDADDDGGTTLGYQWQWVYRHSSRIYYGLHGMGEMGRWNDWRDTDDQEHKLGPVLVGRLRLGDGRRLNYDVGLLFGATEATPDRTLRVKLEYEF